MDARAAQLRFYFTKLCKIVVINQFSDTILLNCQRSIAMLIRWNNSIGSILFVSIVLPIILLGCELAGPIESESSTSQQALETREGETATSYSLAIDPCETTSAVPAGTTTHGELLISACTEFGVPDDYIDAEVTVAPLVSGAATEVSGFAEFDDCGNHGINWIASLNGTVDACFDTADGPVTDGVTYQITITSDRPGATSGFFYGRFHGQDSDPDITAKYFADGNAITDYKDNDGTTAAMDGWGMSPSEFEWVEGTYSGLTIDNITGVSDAFQAFPSQPDQCYVDPVWAKPSGSLAVDDHPTNGSKVRLIGNLVETDPCEFHYLEWKNL